MRSRIGISPVLSDINGSISGSLVGNAATATKLQTARKIAGVNFDGSSDISISPANINAAAAVSGWLNSGNGSPFTTAQFVTWLNEQGAFEYKCWIARCSWAYAGNNYIDDTGCGRVDLSGSVIEVFSNANTSSYTIRVTTPTTTGHGALLTLSLYTLIMVMATRLVGVVCIILAINLRLLILAHLLQTLMPYRRVNCRHREPSTTSLSMARQTSVSRH